MGTFVLTDIQHILSVNTNYWADIIYLLYMHLHPNAWEDQRRQMGDNQDITG